MCQITYRIKSLTRFRNFTREFERIKRMRASGKWRANAAQMPRQSGDLLATNHIALDGTNATRKCKRDAGNANARSGLAGDRRENCGRFGRREGEYYFTFLAEGREWPAPLDHPSGVSYRLASSVG